MMPLQLPQALRAAFPGGRCSASQPGINALPTCNGLSRPLNPCACPAGILLELRDTPPLPPHPPCQHWQRLHRRFNPPNRIASLFAAGKKRQARDGGSSAAATSAAGQDDSRGAGPGDSSPTEPQQAAGEAQQQKKARRGEAPAPSCSAPGGDQPSSQSTGCHQAGQAAADLAAAERQQVTGSNSGEKQSQCSGKAGKLQKQQPEAGQRSIGSFFCKK